MSASEAHAAVKRAAECGLLDQTTRKAKRSEPVRAASPGPWRVLTDCRGAMTTTVVDNHGRKVCDATSVADAQWIVANGPQ